MTVVVATIPINQSQTGNIPITDGRRVKGFIMPAGWDAAPITPLASADGTNFFPIHDSTGTEISFTVAAGRVVHLPPTIDLYAPFLRLRSGNTAAAVNQTAARAIQVLIREES